MTQTSEMQAPACTISINPLDYISKIYSDQPDPPTPRPPLIDQYIIVCPDLFDMRIGPKFDYFDAVSLRLEEFTYATTKEDQWTNDQDFVAIIYSHEDDIEKLVYVPYMGRLYCIDRFDEVTMLIAALREYESKKIIPAATPGHSTY